MCHAFTILDITDIVLVAYVITYRSVSLRHFMVWVPSPYLNKQLVS